MKFSRRIVAAYSCIIIIPLFIIVIIITGIVRSRQYKELQKQCDDYATAYKQGIEKNMSTIDFLERMVRANDDLMLFFTVPENHSEAEIINTMRDEGTAIDRVLSVVPEIYAVRIFSNNDMIPERWPVFMHLSRTKLPALDRWEYNYTAEYLGNLGQQKMRSVCTTRRLEKNKRQIGYIQIAIKMTDFFPFLYTQQNKYQNDYVFVETKGSAQDTVVLTPVVNETISKVQGGFSLKDIQSLVQELNSHRTTTEGQFMVSSNYNKRFISWRRIEDMNLVIIHSSSMKMIQHNLFIIQISILFGLIGTAVALFFVIQFTTTRLMSGVYLIMDGMRKVKSGNLDVVISVDHHDEVGEAQQTFNAMTEKLRSQIEQIKTEQQLIADTEMKAMQNQINAHFLYNVLETIRMQAVVANQEDIAESITVLGKMMRYCLRWRIHVVTVEQEIEYIRSYVYILNVRNDYIISLQTEVPQQFAAVEIPKMVMQPLIENAFTHAIEPEGKDAIIKVFVKLDETGERLLLCVQDFGCGMNHEQLEKIRAYLADDSYERDSKGSIGLKNIQQRLTMFYGKDYRMLIKSQEGKGTLVCVPIPFTNSLATGE